MGEPFITQAPLSAMASELGVADGVGVADEVLNMPSEFGTPTNKSSTQDTRKQLHVLKM